MTLLDDGLHALIAPRDGEGGAGLVLGALAAAAGLAVLGAAVRRSEGSLSQEDFEKCLAALPQCNVTHAQRYAIDDFVGDDDVGVMMDDVDGWWDRVREIADRFPEAMYPDQQSALRADPQTRAIFTDWLIEQDAELGEALALRMAKQPHILCIGATDLKSSWEPDRERTICWRYKKPRNMDQHELAAAARALVKLYGLDPSVVPDTPYGPTPCGDSTARKTQARAWETIARIDLGDDREPRGCGPAGPGRYYYRDLAVTLPVAGKKLRKKR